METVNAQGVMKLHIYFLFDFSHAADWAPL